jgi:hypothetical protein
MQPITDSPIKTLDELARELALFLQLPDVLTDEYGSKLYLDSSGGPYRINYDPQGLPHQYSVMLAVHDKPYDGEPLETVVGTLVFRKALAPDEGFVANLYGSLSGGDYAVLAPFDNKHAGLVSRALSGLAPKASEKLRRSAYRISPV